jgi:WD40 repeat protein
MAFSPDGRFLACGGSDNLLKIFEVVVGTDTLLEPYKLLEGHEHFIMDLTWLGEDIITVSMDKTAMVWHLDRDYPVFCFRHEDIVTSV